MLKDYAQVMVKGENGDNFKSKKILRETIASVPELVLWYEIGTPLNSLRDRLIGRTSALLPLIPSAGLIVHGPDPYRERKWIAKIESKAGKVKVS